MNHIKMDIPPPKKLYQALELAMKDLRAVEKMKTVNINMGNWFDKTNESGCFVCLAGAVMYRHSKQAKYGCGSASPMRFLGSWERIFYALDNLRAGNIRGAMMRFYDQTQANLDVNVIEYHADRVQFKKDMKKVLNILKDNDI